MNKESGRPLRRSMVMLIIAVLVASVFLGALAIFHEQTRSSTPNESYYLLQGSVTSQDFSKGIGGTVVKNMGMNVSHSTSHKGLICEFGNDAGVVLIGLSKAADTVSLSMNISGIFKYQDARSRTSFSFDGGDGRAVEATFDIGIFNTSITYVINDGDRTEQRYADLFYDLEPDVDLLVQIRNGSVQTGINGIGDMQALPDVPGFLPQSNNVILGCDNIADSTKSLVVYEMQSGMDVTYVYHDILHKTIVPDGMDMGLSLHMHADRAFLQNFELMAKLSQRYGLKGTYDAWSEGNYGQYGLDSQEYNAALHLMNEAGWDIGIHAGAPRNLSRDQVIDAIAAISNEFGSVRTGSDHGANSQDLAYEGMSSNSDSYVKDLVQGIGAAWVVNNSISRSNKNDLNKEGMNCTANGIDGVPLFRVSRHQATSLFFFQGRQHNIGSWLRGMASDRALIVSHDYMAFYFYVVNETGAHSVLPDHDGIRYMHWNILQPKIHFKNCTWYPIPRFIEMLDFMANRTIWFAPVRDIYDRSCLVQKVIVQENETYVRIINGDSQRVSGLTLFTNSAPDYTLSNGLVYLVAKKGSFGSWHFVLDLEPGEDLLLKKQATGPSAGLIEISRMVSGSIIWARDELLYL